MTTGLARVTISTPRRRLDVALPEQVPVAELLPEVLRHAGDGLADDGERHGGWVLRRADGAALAAGQALSPQGVRDGELLFLLPARVGWEEPRYDDVVEAIADGAKRRGPSWSPAATRAAGLVAAAVPLALGLAATVRAAPQWTVLAPVLLLAAGAVAARSRRDGAAGAVLGGSALPYAFVAGALPAAPDRPSQALAGAAALLVASLAGAVAVAAHPRVFVAGGTVGLAGGLAALAATAGLSPHGAAAAALVVLACGVGAIPLLAIRLGRLPLPPAGPPPGGTEAPHPAPGDVDAAVGRAEEALSGMLIGHAVLTVASSLVLVTTGGLAGRLLVGVASVGLLLRARLFAAVHHRVPLLAAGLGGAAALGVALVATATPQALLGLSAGGALAAVGIVTAGTTYARRPPSPYLGRAADVLDTVLVVCVVPLALGVLDVYAAVRDL